MAGARGRRSCSTSRSPPPNCRPRASATNRRVLSLQTAKWGMASRDTESPLEALRWLDAGETFDLAILDMHMPEMDGLALARQIRDHHAALPLVLFSSLGRREAGDNAQLFSAYLAK